MVSVKDSQGNTFQVPKDDPRYISGELVGVVKGRRHTITVIDKDGNKLQIYNDDPKFLSGELVHMAKNRIWVNNGEISKMILSSEIDGFLNTHPNFKIGRK